MSSERMRSCLEPGAASRQAYLRRRFRKGVALPWTALLIMVMVLMVGLSIDFAIAAVAYHQEQNAADAAALAGAQIVKTGSTTEVIQRAWDTANLNGVIKLAVDLDKTAQFADGSNADTIDVIVGRWVIYSRTFVPTLDAPNAVRAVVRRGTGSAAGGLVPISLIFGQIVGTDTVDLEQDAVAWCRDSSGAGLICLSEDAIDPTTHKSIPGLYLSGTADLDVEGGGIHVNSKADLEKSDAGAYIKDNPDVDAGFINVVGSTDPLPESDAWASIFADDDGTSGFSVTNGAEPVADPLAAALKAEGAPYVDTSTWNRLDVPTIIDNPFPTRTQTVEGTPITGTLESTCTLAPGYYPYGIRLTNSGATITLDPDADGYTGRPIYIFGGGVAGDPDCGLYVNGGNLIGHGVTCYVTKSYGLPVADQRDGVIRLMGTGTIELLSPGDQLRADGVLDADVNGLEGIALWQDTQNLNFVHLNGGGDLNISGTLYFPTQHTVLEGNLGQAGNQILCGSAEVTGKATITVDYDQRNQGESSVTSLLVE